jgi:hypothetical protein
MEIIILFKLEKFVWNLENKMNIKMENILGF